MITVNNIQDWLEDPDGNELVHDHEIVSDSHVTTSIDLDSQKVSETELDSLLGSSLSHSAPARLTALHLPLAICPWYGQSCEVSYTPVNGEKERAASQFMDSAKVVTQSRSSRGRLDGPCKHGDLLQTPARSTDGQELGCISLEIRRARGQIFTQCVPDVRNRNGPWVDEVSIDLIDDPAEDQLPWAVLSFDFIAGENYGLSSHARDRVRRLEKRNKEKEGSDTSGHPSKFRTRSGKNDTPKQRARVTKRRRLRGSSPKKTIANLDDTDDGGHIEHSGSDEMNVDDSKPGSEVDETARMLREYEAAKEEEKQLHQAISAKLKAVTKRNEHMRRLLFED